MDRKNRRAFGLSLVAIVIYMSHFWWVGTIVSSVQWVGSWCLRCSLNLLQHSCAGEDRRSHEMDAGCCVCYWMHSVDCPGYKRFSAPRSSNDVVAQQVNSLFAAGIR